MSLTRTAFNRFRFNSSSYYSSDYPTGEFVFKPVTAYDPRISCLYLEICDLSCGWAILDEIHRQILNFRKSGLTVIRLMNHIRLLVGKWVVVHLPSIQHESYYIACACDEIYAPPCAYVHFFGFTLEATFSRGVYDKLGIEPQIERIGKYKPGGNGIMCTRMSEDIRESMTALLDDIHSNWLDKVSSERKEKTVENFINEGVYQPKRLEEEGFITSVLYDHEILIRLKEKLQVKLDKSLPVVYFRKYSRVRKWTVGISDGKEKIAIIRASGRISSTGDKGTIADDFIKKIRRVRGSNTFKAAII